MYRGLALVAFLCTALSGCVAYVPPQLSSADCAPGNWAELGYADGRSGRPPESFSQRAAQCAPYGPPREVAWSQGYAQGLAEFCVPDQGYALGLDGEAVAVACPPDQQRDFIAAYRAGQADASLRVVSPTVIYTQPNYYRPVPWYNRPVRRDPYYYPRPDRPRYDPPPRPDPPRRPDRPVRPDRPDRPVLVRPEPGRPKPEKPRKPRRRLLPVEEEEEERDAGGPNG